MEGTHRELRSRLPDRLRSDHAHCLAKLDHAAGGKVTSVAHDADSALRFAGEHRANLDSLDACSLNRNRKIFRDLTVYVDDHVSFVVLDLLE